MKQSVFPVRLRRFFRGACGNYARSSRKAGNRGASGKGKGTRPYHQRCAVRATYLKNKIRGQWKAHGRYLARESATFETDAKAVGFDRGSDVDIARRLESWQTAGDAQIWKLIVSPEFGDRADLSRLTRGLIERMEKDLGTSLEWVAVEHNNTEHPHVHVVVRGVRDDGEVLLMSREYVQRGIRGIAEDLCTRQLGYRTEIDAADAESEDFPQLRAGVAVGLALPRAGDWFGRPVNLASRITQIARPGSLLAEREVRESAPESYRWSYAGERRLRGIREPVPLFRARRLTESGS